MHYYSYRRFVGLVRGIGFEVIDPETPDVTLPRLLHGLARRLSLGFNSATLTLMRTAGAHGSSRAVTP